MSHGKPITIRHTTSSVPTTKRRDVLPGRVFSHGSNNAVILDLFVALDECNPYVQQVRLDRDECLLAMQVATGIIVHTNREAWVFLHDADLTVGGAK